MFSTVLFSTLLFTSIHCLVAFKSLFSKLLFTSIHCLVAFKSAPNVTFGLPSHYFEISKNVIPPFANDFNCKSSLPPVVLVHGTMDNQNVNWLTLSPLLAREGRCPYVFNYGGYPDFIMSLLPAPNAMGMGGISSSAMELATFVDQVLSKTNSKQVDLVGFSQGGMLPHLFIRDLGGMEKVRNFVALSPSNHGTNLQVMEELRKANPEQAAKEDIINLDVMNAICISCIQQLDDSAFMSKLHSKPLPVPRVNYTIISTRNDLTVVPYTSQFLLNYQNVKNYLLQDGCPGRIASHADMPFDERALGILMNALNDKSDPIVC